MLYTYYTLYNKCITTWQDQGGSLGVRMALGETQIVTETREFLIEEGVTLDAFSQVNKIDLYTANDCSSFESVLFAN